MKLSMHAFRVSCHITRTQQRPETRKLAIPIKKNVPIDQSSGSPVIKAISDVVGGQECLAE